MDKLEPENFIWVNNASGRQFKVRHWFSIAGKGDAGNTVFMGYPRIFYETRATESFSKHYLCPQIVLVMIKSTDTERS